MGGKMTGPAARCNGVYQTYHNVAAINPCLDIGVILDILGCNAVDALGFEKHHRVGIANCGEQQSIGAQR